ncbi:proteasome regulatory particle lid subunit RPN5 [Sugiyamaella lignohabitans]|uniref:Proteasome regulatory particle lid subunit RPN5 n=1 Tax=Sugiyamaella lignohabitans TaxID=796027 RepID=A0A167FAN0_9ASCO|nr:proteasome regulatory particle lid subunit RPN5 [Sugiyamaella lignohabitans]ANB15039.1 proteasome regulatory particle lid subunit RPN5 [Sugiyamaella lignohabitans]
MNEQIQLLSKKHGQLKQAITSLIQEAVKGVDNAPDQATKVETIENIRTVTEGKIFVEVERARVTRILSQIKEANGDIDSASEILGELQVETYGSMEMREKTEFILEQVQLYIKKGDFIQALIVSRKIVPRYFNNEEVHDLKLRYYELMIKIALHDNKYLDTCQYYRSVYETPIVAKDETKWKQALENIVFFIILSPYDNLQSDLIHKIAVDHNLESLPLHLELLQCFTADELIRWPKVEEIYGSALKASSSGVFDVKTPEGRKRWDDLRKRVIEHNIRVVAIYYTRITTSRLTSLLDLTERETEEFLSKLVTQGTIYARINRPERIITFSKPKDSNDVLNEWSSNITTLLSHVETIGHLITKEEMMHGIRASTK